MFDFTYIYILTAIALIVLLTIIRRSNHLEERKNRQRQKKTLKNKIPHIIMWGDFLYELIPEFIHFGNTIFKRDFLSLIEFVKAVYYSFCNEISVFFV